MKTSMTIREGNECPDNFKELADLRNPAFSYCMFNEVSPESKDVIEKLLLEAGYHSKSYNMNLEYYTGLSDVTKRGFKGEERLKLYDYIKPYLRKPDGGFSTKSMGSSYPGFFFRTNSPQGKTDFNAIVRYMEETLDVELKNKPSFTL